MNFLTVVLCMVMDRPYQFYYFVPLVTFWYIVIYVTMALAIPFGKRSRKPTNTDLPEVDGEKIKAGKCMCNVNMMREYLTMLVLAFLIYPQ